MSLKREIYYENCLSLARSILLKSDQLAREVEYKVDPDLDMGSTDRRTWKYYLNTSGEYHGTDELMTMVSLDTLQSIELRKDVLVNHPVTMARLREFGTDFRALVDRYPNQIGLLYGLVYSLNIDDVIAADEFTILGYNKALVEMQEINLMADLQQYVTSTGLMVASHDLVDIEDGYALHQCYKLSQMLVPYIKVIRLKNHLTARAHSYFIWTHINQRVYLEDLKAAFSTREIIYLYKNIDRLLDLSGTKGILDELFVEFINSRNLAGYNLHISKDVQTIANREDLELRYVNQGINTLEDRLEPESVILDSHQARSQRALDDYGTKLIKAMAHGNDSIITREITLVDDSAEVASTRALLTAVDLSYLLMGNFTGTYNVVNHITTDTYNLTYRECCILYLRLCQTRLDAKTEFVPRYHTHQVPKRTAPVRADLLAKYDITADAVDELLTKQVRVPTGIDDELGAAQFKRDTIWWFDELSRIVTSQYVLENTHSLPRIYDEFVEVLHLDLVPTDDVNFNEWLIGKGITLDGMEVVDLALMEEQILTQVFRLTITEGADTTVSRMKEFLSRFVTYRTNIDTLLLGNSDTDAGILPVFLSHASPIDELPVHVDMSGLFPMEINTPPREIQTSNSFVEAQYHPHERRNLDIDWPYVGNAINIPEQNGMEQTLILDI